MRHPFRAKNVGPRLIPLYALAALALALARPSAASLAAGAPLALAGLGLRLWATGYLRKTRELCVSGPYAHLRHPLYAGTLLLALGLSAAAGPRSALVIGLGFLPFFFLSYLPRKERSEAARLAGRHGGAFAEYRAAVPALAPRLRPWRAASAAPAPRWSLARVHENDEWGVVAGVVLAALALALRATW